MRQMEPLVKERFEDVVTILVRERADPLISEIYRRAGKVRSEEVAKTVSKLKPTPEQERILEKMSLSIVEKLLAFPASNLRKAAERGDSQTLQLAGQLFGVE